MQITTVSAKGKTRIITNNGRVQLNMNDNRVLTYDGSKYRFIAGDNNSLDSKIIISKEGVNVLDA